MNRNCIHLTGIILIESIVGTPEVVPCTECMSQNSECCKSSNNSPFVYLLNVSSLLNSAMILFYMLDFENRAILTSCEKANQLM